MKRRFTLPLAPTLPEEMIEEILLRLPVRSVLRFKCVCKSWLSLTSDPQFAKSHFDLAAVPTHRILKFSKYSIAKSAEIDNPFQLNSAELVVNIPHPSPDRNHKWRIDVVGSCRGFLLLAAATSDIIYFLIWNPSTSLEKRFNKVWSMLPYLCGIGYDSSTDDYVVVMITLPLLHIHGRLGTEIHCFSSRTNSWSYTENTVPYISFSNDFSHHGSLLHGAVHWLVHSYYGFHPVIIAFDVMERKLSEIPLPPDLADRSEIYDLRLMGKCLCLCFLGYESGPAEMWMMKEYKVQSSWTKLYILPPICYPPRCYFAPICFTRDGEILGYDNSKTLVRLHHRGELLEHRVHGQCEGIYRFPHCGMYRESLLSLPDIDLDHCLRANRRSGAKGVESNQ
ncbi:F-box protein CPR30, partial [Mucuna pruriens]